MEHVEGDAKVLRLLAARDFPAERCAHEEPVSELNGQGVMVTEHIAGQNARMDSSGATLFGLGEVLGRLHALPGAQDAVAREAGGWHHISVNGGSTRADVEALLPLVAATEDDVAPEDQESFELAREQLSGVDGCGGLPRALIHPNPCSANAVITVTGVPVLVDWSGAGPGARVLSLGALLAGSMQPAFGSPPSRDLTRVDAIIAGYRTHVRLTDDEFAKLPAAIAGGGIVLDCWSYLFRYMPLREVARSIGQGLEMSEHAAARAVEAFDLDEEELTGWYKDSPPAVHPGQGALF
jgi:Ser/Thr protein kinase RdoA (MazF antagonist)